MSARPGHPPCGQVGRGVAAAYGLTAVATALLLPSVAWASGDVGFEFTIHGFYLVDFAVFVGLLVYFGRRPIAAFLDGRYKTVAAEIEEARALREAAQQRFDAYKARLEALESEVAAALQDVRAGTMTEVKRILEDARATADRIAAEEHVRLQQESKRLRDELAAYAASTALELAERELRGALTPQVQAELVARTIAELERGEARVAHGGQP